MATNFKTKVSILAEFMVEMEKGLNTDWEGFVKSWSLSLPLAYAAQAGWCKLTPLGIEKVEDCWFDLLNTFNVEDTGYSDLASIVKASPNPLY